MALFYYTIGTQNILVISNAREQYNISPRILLTTDLKFVSFKI